MFSSLKDLFATWSAKAPGLRSDSSCHDLFSIRLHLPFACPPHGTQQTSCVRLLSCSTSMDCTCGGPSVVSILIMFEVDSLAQRSSWPDMLSSVAGFAKVRAKWTRSPLQQRPSG